MLKVRKEDWKRVNKKENSRNDFCWRSFLGADYMGVSSFVNSRLHIDNMCNFQHAYRTSKTKLQPN